MDLNFLSQINYLAVAASSVILFVLGSMWFSPLLFSSIWVQELVRHNVTRQQPSSNDLMTKMATAFGINAITSFGIACLVVMTGSVTLTSGLVLGLITSLSFAATTLGSVFMWEGRSLKLFLIDIGYPVASIIISAMLLSWWR